MILSALVGYYQRLLNHPDPNTGQPKVPAYGYSAEKIAYVILLSRDGEVVDVQSNLDTTGKKPVPRLISVPRPEKRTSGIKPNFMWDKTAYVLGVESNKDKSAAKEQPWVVADKTFQAFKQLHLEKLQSVEDVGLQALCKFLQSWQPTEFAQAPFSAEMVDANVVFRLDGDYEFLHEKPETRQIWGAMLVPDDDALIAPCLVTGEASAVARLHPPIKGVYGGQSSGGSIVSFNADAYASYGKVQGENAPVSEAAAFAYTTALNYLLRRDNRQCVSIGDASTVFWAVASDETSAQEAEQFFAACFDRPVDDAEEQARIRPFLEKISHGRPLAECNPGVDLQTRFYILGLAPNAARISIRYWMDTTFGELAEHVAQHFRDMQLEPCAWREPPSIWRLLIQTAAQGKSENIPPQLAGELMRSIVTGQRYPRMLLSQLTQRVRVDGDVTGLRAALIKAVLQRDYRKRLIQEEVPVGLDRDNKNVAYLLGRLFAVIERIQEATLGDVNSSVVDKYYGSASSIPFSVFPRLLAGSQNHLAKLRRDKHGYAVLLGRDMGEIVDGLGGTFPKHFSMEDQGRFAIGYYQQKQHYFTTRGSKNEKVLEADAVPED
ncbi:type I-C CRISPR-associated protein Cas8c/Csd1 [Methylobacillus flagellatus]|uniref:CRISPR-associated protein, Csd1 family n=1 Tax=Methylobacillus flagellatus (strain ATCC 51484 / DSM 6875 / VKM B-1610 / KT) TaxID=265072 RepID=Q1H3R4_METFK|nr:type I-C CRISPR-associated protein Cas8c/Csd1 [Methylobacillus flagellatus]ABE48873.1 CRISPR-associated protein, Csd1 family [Methylobacillus flagellatus KT]